MLKRFGKGNEAPLSFPQEGFTLALDIPIHDPQLFSFLQELDELVLTHRGKIYLAKDSRMDAYTFREMYPKLPRWLATKRKYDPGNHFQSDLARRLSLPS